MGVGMNSLNTEPLRSMGLHHDKSEQFNHSDEEFDEVLEDGLRLNDMVQQLKKQIEVQERDNLALIERNGELEAENSKLKSMLAKAQVDFLKQGGSDGHDMVNQPPHYMQHAMECIDEMVEVFGVDAVISYCLCNVWKYRYRAPHKGKFEEDNMKSDWYMHALSDLRKYGRVHSFKIVKNSSEKSSDND